MKQLYNEGRVSGFSAYEVYVKHHMSENPELPPASEREWLSSSIGPGSSMILRISKDQISGRHYIDYELPADSKLCAANTIFGNLFLGETNANQNQFATTVESYGEGVSNTSASHPSGKVNRAGTISANINSSEDTNRIIAREYTNIADGLVIQPGNWVRRSGSTGSAYSDLYPDMSQTPRVRIIFKDKIQNDFNIILTGFTIRSVISGVSGQDGSLNPSSPDDGSAFGPSQFPWAAKIIFSINSDSLDQALKSSFYRQMYNVDSSTFGNNIETKGKSVVDMEQVDMNVYYNRYPKAQVPLRVNEYYSPDKQVNLMSIYSKKSKYPPALYGSKVTANGDTKMNPLGTVAPGSVFMMDSSASASDIKDYEDTFDGTFAMKRNDDGTISTIDAKNTLVDIAKVSTKNITATVRGSTENIGKAVVVQAGRNKEVALSIGPGGSDAQYTISGDPSTSQYVDYITIYNLFSALTKNTKLDILGTRIMNARDTLMKAESSSANQCPYLEFGPENNKKRLYISNTKPTGDIPVGSIGIGWTE